MSSGLPAKLSTQPSGAPSAGRGRTGSAWPTRSSRGSIISPRVRQHAAQHNDLEHRHCPWPFGPGEGELAAECRANRPGAVTEVTSGRTDRVVTIKAAERGRWVVAGNAAPTHHAGFGKSSRL